jgi:hypothetical protein
MKTSNLRWMAIAASIVLSNVPLLAPQAYAAPPPPCVLWAWSRCDPWFDRGTPEWGECFDYQSGPGCPVGDGWTAARPLQPTAKPEALPTLLERL